MVYSKPTIESSKTTKPVDYKLTYLSLHNQKITFTKIVKSIINSVETKAVNFQNSNQKCPVVGQLVHVPLFLVPFSSS